MFYLIISIPGGRRVRGDPHGDSTEQNRSGRPSRRRCVIY